MMFLEIHRISPVLEALFNKVSGLQYTCFEEHLSDGFSLVVMQLNMSFKEALSEP